MSPIMPGLFRILKPVPLLFNFCFWGFFSDGKNPVYLIVFKKKKKTYKSVLSPCVRYLGSPLCIHSPQPIECLNSFREVILQTSFSVEQSSQPWRLNDDENGEQRKLRAPWKVLDAERNPRGVMAC